MKLKIEDYESMYIEADERLYRLTKEHIDLKLELIDDNT